jgi:hypothetical protein
VPSLGRRRTTAGLRLGRLGQFVRALAPDPSEWSYDGTCIDHGPRSRARCVCGQPIRYVFVVTRGRDGSSIDVGSVCITTAIPQLLAGGAGALAERLADGVRRHQTAVRERDGASDADAGLGGPPPRARDRRTRARAHAHRRSPPPSTQLTLLSTPRRHGSVFQFNGDHSDLTQVAPFIADFAVLRAKILAATGRSFAYDDEFVDRLPAIANKTKRPSAGTHEDAAIYLLQKLYRAREQEARLLDLRASGYEEIAELDGTTSFEHVVLYPQTSHDGPWEEFTSARLAAREIGAAGTPFWVLKKGARTRGTLVNERGILARRKRR